MKLGTLIQELGKSSVLELGKVTSRSKAMVACYPGAGARYVKHVDNDGKHPLCRTRLLTALPLFLMLGGLGAFEAFWPAVEAIFCSESGQFEGFREVSRRMGLRIYLNGSWREGDGGELAIFEAEDQSSLRRTVTPLQKLA